MKKQICLLVIICLGCRLSAQIGINTSSPQQLLHIDGKGNTVGVNNISDDVVVDAKGNLGIGTLSPTAKIHIDATGSTVRALHIPDNNAGDGKVLGSIDNDGNMSWLTPPTSWAKVFYLTGGVRKFSNVGGQQMYFSTQIPETGNYLILVRWWGSADVNYGNATSKFVSAYFALKEGINNTPLHSSDSQKDNIEFYVKYPTSNKYYTFTAVLRANITAGRWIKLYISPSAPNQIKYNWVIGHAANPQMSNIAINPSVVIFKI